VGGLRGQIVIALAAGFGSSVVLLAVISTNLADAALDHDRREATAAAARALLAATEGRDPRPILRAALSAGPYRGVRLTDRDEVVLMMGEAVRGTAVAAPVTVEAGDRRLELTLPPGPPTAARPLSNLLVLYSALTAAVILLLTYLLLTRLIVRPIERLTRASERLGEGKEAAVPEGGAGELRQLAESFNVMGRALSAERGKLQARLAELEEATQELRSAQSSLVRSEKLASVGRLAAGVAHEVGNPLAAIQGLLDLAADTDLDEDTRLDFLRRSQRETERIHRILRDLLAFARGEDPEVGQGPQHADLVRVIDDALALLRPQPALRRVEVRTELAPAEVRGGPARLTQIVLNLLLNAAEAIDGAGTIDVRLTRAEATATLEILDDGPGIDPEVLGSLFEPFVTTKPIGEGTGLGLAVSRRLVEQLDGTLEGGNRPEGGARFVLVLPLHGASMRPPAMG
jgi:two-component system NtrC family sensor kinase